MLTGVPQPSVLETLLSLIHNDGFNDNITSNVLKFADTKVFRRVKNESDKQHLQNDLHKLFKLCEKWQMNFLKCKCLHTGHGNLYVNL